MAQTQAPTRGRESGELGPGAALESTLLEAAARSPNQGLLSLYWSLYISSKLHHLCAVVAAGRDAASPNALRLTGWSYDPSEPPIRPV